MQTVALTAATLTALVFIAVGIRALFLQSRIARLVDQAGRLLDSEVTPAVRAWREAAEGVRTAATTLDSGCGSLASALDRVDRLTEKLEPDSLMRTMVGPAIVKIASWVAGFRKGIASVHGAKAEEGLDD
jgi:hypothetical protein